ncbi:Fe2OG dioxygenase domain-containing protein [Mycena indigotica]|uniref:Fe2OG dioxygenase domain-containing protein n=1 Tax=Mycena indigotica TaxID=2126181 RepID=A0A8H6SGQ0_9AGAR|nr:Fe2OG dioxygenase domain-containing protein [Mycena indigotica]KAF7297520.1 Fe2OG dioxygenase domain-containing protein [Mycena indigotica]
MTNPRHDLKVFHHALKEKALCASGAVLVTKNSMRILYNSSETAGWSCIEMGNPSSNELRALCNACNGAGWLDSQRLMPTLDVGVVQGIVAQIAPDIVKDYCEDGTQLLRAELDGLSVYGPGTKTKKTKVKPVSASHVGTLLVFLPTQHTGGEIKLTEGNRSRTTRFSPTNEEPTKAAYLAFRHEVTALQAGIDDGYRVALRYKLFLDVVDRPEEALTAALRTLAAEPDALFPVGEGGWLAFGLQHVYSGIPRTPRDKDHSLASALAELRGPDARVRIAAEHAGLPVAIRLVYPIQDRDNEMRQQYSVVADKAVYMPDATDDGYEYATDDQELLNAGQVLCPVKVPPLKRKRGYEEADTEVRDSRDCAWEDLGQIIDPEKLEFADVFWVTRLTKINAVESDFVEGDAKRPDIGYRHGYAALFVHLPLAAAAQEE